MIIILTLKLLLKRTWIDRCGSSTAYKQRYMIPRNKRFKPSETLKQMFITFTSESFLLAHTQKFVLLTQKTDTVESLLPGTIIILFIDKCAFHKGNIFFHLKLLKMKNHKVTINKRTWCDHLQILRFLSLMVLCHPLLLLSLLMWLNAI